MGERPSGAFVVHCNISSAPLRQGHGGAYGMLASIVRLLLVIRQHLQRTSPLKLLGQFQLNFICSLQAMGEGGGEGGGENIYIWPRSHDQAVRHSHICKKNFKNLLLQNCWADCLDTWYVASGDLLLQSLCKWWPWLDLDLFYGNVVFGTHGLEMEKAEKVNFSDAFVLFGMVVQSDLVPLKF